MRIHQSQGQFVQNQYNRTNTNLNKTLQKLSSGYQINQAADDAAGLAISEKMEAQIRGLQQAAKNIRDGLSLIQTAEGGMAEIQQSNLQRIRELIIQATNDTNTPEDRAVIQKEIDQTVQGIDDIAEGMEFNAIPVLLQDVNIENQIKPKKFDIVFLIDDSSTMSEEIDSVRVGVGSFVQQLGQYGDVHVGTVSTVLDSSNNRDLALTGDLDAVIDHLNTKHTTRGGFSYTYDHLDELMKGQNSVVQFRSDSQRIVIILSDTKGDEKGANVTQDELKTTLEVMGVQTYVFGLDFVDGGNNFRADASYTFADAIYKPASPNEIADKLTTDLVEVIKESAGVREDQREGILIQTGANQGQQIAIPLYNNRPNALGIANIRVDEYFMAMEGLRRVDMASRMLSERRSAYGAIQNRLEHAHSNVSNMEINLTDAKSKLKDADMVKETMKLHRGQLLLESTKAMMVKVNRMGQGILKLLE